MNAPQLRRRDVIVIVGVFAVLVLLGLPALKGKAKSKRISCVLNLKNLGLGYRIFATDNGDRFPWETNQPAAFLKFDEYARNIVVISNELSTPKITICPADIRKPARDWQSFTRENSSYFLGVSSAETYPQSFLAGDRNLTTNGVRLGPGRVILTPESNVDWDTTQHNRQGNAAMGDGSVQQLSIARIRDQLKNTGQTNTVLLLP